MRTAVHRTRTDVHTLLTTPNIAALYHACAGGGNGHLCAGRGPPPLVQTISRLADEPTSTRQRPCQTSTQSALLEVMEENSITVDGVTRPVPQAVSGHRERETPPVPPARSRCRGKSQLDRLYGFRLSMGLSRTGRSEMEMHRRHQNAVSLDTNPVSRVSFAAGPCAHAARRWRDVYVSDATCLPTSRSSPP
jgi:hypothetical protein